MAKAFFRLPMFRYRQPCMALMLAWALPLATPAQPVALKKVYDQSGTMVGNGDAEGMAGLLDSLRQKAPDSREAAILRELLQARWQRHEGKTLEAEELLRTLEIDPGENAAFLLWIREYQHAKALMELELYGPARKHAVAAGGHAASIGMGKEAFDMELLGSEIDLLEGHYRTAMGGFEELLQRAGAQGHHEGICRALIGLGSVFYYQEQDSMAAVYFRKALLQALKLHEDGFITSALLNLGAAISYTEGPEHAIDLYRSVLDTQPANYLKRTRADLFANMGSMYSDLGDHERALTAIDSALNVYGSLRDTASMARANLFKATALWALGRQKPALEQVLMAKQRTKGRETVTQAARKAADYLEAMGRHAEAYDLLKEYAQLNDSLAREKYHRDIARAQVRFGTAEKEHRIVEQKQALELAEARDRRKNFQRLVLALATLAIAIIAGLLWRSLQHRRKLAKQERALHLQQVDDLIQRNEINTINAMLEGQEKERDRMAKDLHDRLGAMLSTIKMQVGALEDKVELVHEDQRTQYTRVNTLLDEAVGEVRRISHDLNSLTLSRFGLAKALEDLCDGVRVRGKLEVELKLFGLERRMEKSMEVVVYRIVQELISNALKHAKAHEISVSVTRETGRLSVIVSDDGRGFDPARAHQGIGLDNVRSRAASIGAAIQIDSTPGHGTTVSMEAPVIE